MTNYRVKLPTLLAIAGVAGCADDGGYADLTTFRDSAGVRIAENVSPADSAKHAWWSIGNATVDIGGADAVEPYALHRITAAIRQPDGSIVVGSDVAGDIRVFSASGEHIRTTGRRGGGPGEFESISWMGRVAGDSILVFDSGNRRFTLLDAAGAYVRVIPAVTEITRVYGQFADGSLMVVGGNLFTVPAGGFSPDQVTRIPTQLSRFSIAEPRLDSLGAFPGTERVIRVSTRPDGEVSSVSLIMPPFSKQPSFAVAASEFYVGAQDGPEIQVYDTTGALRRIIRTGRAPEPVTQAHLDAQFERRLQQMPERLRTEMRASGPPDQPHGDFVPPYGELIVDRLGNLWVADYNDPLDPPGRWTIYDANGAVVARIRLPEDFRPLDIGADYVLGRELDDLDTEHIRVYPLVR